MYLCRCIYICLYMYVLYEAVEADKGSAAVIWDREDYLREANSQLSDKDVHGEVKGYAEDNLMKVIKSVLRKIKNRGDISDEILDYFLVNNLRSILFASKNSQKTS